MFRMLQQYAGLRLVGLADLSGKASWLSEAERKNYFVTGELTHVTALPELQVVLDATGDKKVGRRLRDNLKAGVELVELPSGGFLTALIRSREQLLETRLLKGELWAILNSVQDAVEVVDGQGIVKYVNPAFTRVTGIPEKERVNRNIFEVSPHGALAQSGWPSGRWS